MPHRADISHNEMRYRFTSYWKTEQEIILNELDREVYKNVKLDPIWKIVKKADLSHCSLQSEMIWGKGWTTPAKHKFSHLPVTPIFSSSLYIIAPQEYSALQFPVTYTQLHALRLPVAVTGLGNLPVLCWAAVFSFPDEELCETRCSSTAPVSTGHGCCCFPPHPGSALPSPKSEQKTPSLHALQVLTVAFFCIGERILS